MKLNKKINLNKISILLLFSNILIFINYLLFIISFIYFSFELIKEKEFLTKRQIVYLKLIPINYYTFSFVSLFLDNFKSSIFWDMQNFLHYLRCNYSIFKYTYMNDFSEQSCWDSIGYGPLSEILIFPADNIWGVTLGLALIFTLLVLYFLFSVEKNELIVVTILVSPAFQFMYYGLTTDIFIVFYLMFILKKTNFEFSLTNLLILTFLTQLKSFPIFIFLGYLIIYYLRNEIKNLLITFFITFLNAVVLINHYFVSDYFLPAPMSYTRSFGVLHDYKLIFDHISFDELSILILFLLLFGFIFRKRILIFTNQLQNTYNEDIIFLFPSIFFINLYQNWGYKFVFSSLLIYLIFNTESNQSKLFLIIVNLFSISYFSIGWGFEQSIINYILISISKVSFYSFYIIVSINFVKSLLVMIDKKNIKF